MDNIAVIDDRAGQRETVVKYIARNLKRQNVDWGVIGSPPLSNIEEYRAWVTDNEVRVLVLDELLTEEMVDGVAVDYSGHDVAIRLRRELPDLPQIIVTAVVDSDELSDLDGAQDLDAIVAREEFIGHADAYVARMVRMGESYLRRHEAELAEMTRLSEKLITEDLSSAEQERLEALRQKTQSFIGATEGEGMRGWLQEAARIQEALQAALVEVRNGQLKK